MKPTPMKCGIGLTTLALIIGAYWWGKSAPKESPEPPRVEQKR